MARAFVLPDLGEGLTEAEIVTVHVREGDVIKEDAPLLEVETDKAQVEIPSPMSGRVEKIHVRPGQTVKVGEVLVTFADGEPASAVGRGPLARSETPLRREGAAGRAAEVSPLARPAAEAPPLPKFEQYGPIERQPLSHLRRTIAERMTLSAALIPHVTHFDKADITELDAVIRRNLDAARERGVTLTLTSFLLKAAALAPRARTGARRSRWSWGPAATPWRPWRPASPGRRGRGWSRSSWGGAPGPR